MDFFAASMAASQMDFLERIRPEMIVPVPMNPRKRRERGFDQCLLLTQRLSERTGIPLETDLLIRSRHTKAQKGLDLSARKANVRGAFTVKAGKRIPQRVVLVDDIFTTGSTIEECSRTMAQAGTQDIYFLMLCAAQFD